MRAFRYAAGQPWAIQQADLNLILAIAQRAHIPDFEAVAARQAEQLKSARGVEMRGGVAIVNLVGPIFRYANIFSEISGGTSVEQFAKDFTAAVDEPSAESVLIRIDSPGGEAAGVEELAGLIARAREVKPVTAYVDDLAASGGYWIAAAASRIVAPRMAMVGSIGVVATVEDWSKWDEKQGVKTFEFVSSQSPLKRLDLESETGRSEMQRMVDDLGAMFVAGVAQLRGVTEEKVLADFGRGGVMVAERALAAGMIDELGDEESLIARLDAEAGQRRSKMFFGGSAASHSQHKKETTMDVETNPTPAAETPKPDPAIAVADTREAKKAERDRVSGILASEEAKGRDELARHLAFETDMSAVDAKALLARAPKAGSVVGAFEAAMAGVANPKVGVAGTSGADSEQALIAAMVGYGNQVAVAGEEN